MIGFVLGRTMMECPKHWSNFIKSLQDNPYQDVQMQVIRQELARYGARYYAALDHEPMDCVVFDSEEMLTLFVLRWA